MDNELNYGSTMQTREYVELQQILKEFDNGDAQRTSYQTPQHVNQERLVQERVPRRCGTSSMYNQTAR